MIKNVIVSICLLFSLATFAQEGTSSPYSFYGIGDIKFKGTVENRSMGSLSVLPDSIHLNIQNPAHYASLKLTSFSIGGTYANTKSETEAQEAKARRSSLDYMAFAIPVGKVGIGFGLIPYSSLGYKIGKLTNITNSSNEIIRSIYSRYNGVGGVNKVFVGFGYQLTKKLNFGADIQYNFGTITTSSLQYQTDLQYGSRENNKSELRGLNFDLGLTYQTKVNSKYSFFSSLTYTPEAKLSLSNARNIEVVELLSSSAISVVERQNVPVEDTEIKLPSKLGFGLGFGQVKKWLVGGEVTLIQNSVMSNRFNDINGSTFENSVRYSLGGYFIPNYNSYSNYYKRVVYRGGLRYENTGLVLQNKSITDFAGNIGLGLPLSGTFTNINIGLEIGKRGTKYYNLVEENYINISVGLSLSDKWFVKRKFD
jgi:long-subunit fatty acid transport protein